MIAVIAGHRGPKTGATGYIDEGKETIEFRNLILKQLIENGTPFIYEGEKDSLQKVVSDMDALLSPSDICLDIHFNSFSSEKASGSEIIIPEYPDSTEKQLAEDLLKCTCNILKTKNRKVKKESQSKHGRLAMLRDIHCKNILVEICFVSNKQDCDKYLQHKEELAKEYANILTKYDKLS